MKKKVIDRLILVGVIFSIVFAVFIFLTFERHLSYHFEFTYVNTDKFVPQWEVVSKTGFCNEERFRERYRSSTGEELPPSFDTDQQAYIVCYGYTLEGLTYRKDTTSGKTYYVKAYIRESPDGLTYVYAVENDIRIDRNAHISDEPDTSIIQ